ncbi:MAG: DMT family transporter [Betaproteobacteria bacterium]|nr:DMT family transporter [Betaproteobacteria bacterium]
MNAAHRPGHAGVYGKLVLVALIWGGTFIAGRIVAAEVAPASAALWRYVIASVAVLVAHALLEGRLPPLSARQWLGVTLLGATGVAAYNLCFMIGLQTVPASRASLIVALNPAVTYVGAMLLFGERTSPVRGLGVLLALAGAAVVIGHGNPLALFSGGVGTGDAIVFGCVLSWSTYTLIGKRILVGLSPLAATAYASLTGTVLLALVAWWLPAPMSSGIAPPVASVRAWLAFVFLGVFGTAIAFVWFYDGVRALGPARASVFINLVPVAAVLLGFALLNESLEWSMLAGGLLVVCGVWLINRPARPARAPVNPPVENSRCC